MAKIEIQIQANENEQSLDFEQDSITIGRGLGNDILIEDPQVSRYHARLVLEDGALILYDLRSRNGTRVNDEKISSCPIRGDESIFVGAAILKARISTKDSLTNKGRTEEHRPTKHHNVVSQVFEVDEEGCPEETPIYEAQEAVLEVQNEPAQPTPTKPTPKATPILDSVEEVMPTTEKDTESALITNESSPDEPWRPFENCLAGIITLINDPSIETITITSPQKAFVKRNGSLEEVATGLSEGQLQETLRIVSASVKPSHSSQSSAPAFSIRLADGSELAGAGPALAPPYGVLVISTPSHKPRTIQEFLKDKILSQEMFYFLHGCVALRKTILISGTKVSTSQDLLGVLSSCIPANQRITLIQGYSKLELPQCHTTSFAKCMSLSAAVLEAASRTRPDRYIVAETLRGDAIRAFVEQVLNGTLGSLAQLISPSINATISKLETAICQSDGRLPYEAVRIMVREAIQIIVQLYELPNGAQRVRSISELVANPDGSTSSRAIFTLKEDSSALKAPTYQASAPTFLSELELTGFEEAYQVFKKS